MGHGVLKFELDQLTPPLPRKWYGNLKYGATAEYECGPYAHFSNATANITYNTATLECKWNKAWLPDGYSQILRSYCGWPFGLLDYGSAPLRCKI